MKQKFLHQAFQLAQSIDPHKTASNPRVGCVVVRDEKVIATGCHQYIGGDHAEVDALKKLEGQDLSGCTVYVTLEPCDCFTGKQTGSCTQLLIDKKIEKVIIGHVDSRFGGKNVQKLKDAGILVETCYSASHGDDLSHKNINPFYDHFFYTKKPFVCLKMAQSLDGKVQRGIGGEGACKKILQPLAPNSQLPTLSTQHPAIISNTSSRKIVHQMRAGYQAILTTAKTIREDNACLDVRLDSGDLPWKPSNPIILILGKESDIPESHDFWSIEDREVHFFDTHHIDEVIDEAANMGILSIMTELGPTVATQMLKEGLVDEIKLFVAPKIFGSGLALSGQEIDLSQWSLESVQNIEGDLCITYGSPSSKLQAPSPVFEVC